MVGAWQQLNNRQQWVVALGMLFILVFLNALLFIAPLREKTRQLETVANKQQVQLAEMQGLVTTLLSQAQRPLAKDLLGPYLLTQQTLPSGETVLQTQTVTINQAMAWLPSLVAEGKVRVTATEGGVNIRFWE